MIACTTVGGGVMYIPAKVERGRNKISFREFLEKEVKAVPKKIFGKRSGASKPQREAA
jgi:hypothetical protein